MPCYNSQDFVLEAIESVTSQSFQDFELIIIDDGSTDDSRSIIQTVAKSDNRIHPIFSPNKGVANARNIGLQNATGEFIAFIDSDDIMDSKALENFDESIKKHRPELIIGSAQQFENDPRNCIPRRTIREETLLRGHELDSISYAFLSGEYDHANWNKAYKKSFIEAHKLHFETSLTLGQDMIFNWRVWDRVSSVALVPANTIYYRIHPDSATRSNIEKFRHWLHKAQVYNDFRKELKNVHILSCDRYLNEDFWYYQWPKVINSDLDHKKVLLLLKQLNELPFTRQKNVRFGLKLKALQFFFRNRFFKLTIFISSLSFGQKDFN